MRILIYGAGVLGCNVAHDLYKAGKDVTILARGKWAHQIKNNGMIIKGFIFKKVDKIHVITSLEENDLYDIIFVVMQYTQLNTIIPVLQQNQSKNIIFIGNNMNTKKYEQLLNNKNVWFGFSSSAGKREDGCVKSISMHKITIGSASGPCKRPEFIKNVVDGSKLKLTILDDMDEWLKTHIAFILPLANACYRCDGNLKRIKKNDKEINRIIDEMKTNYDLLQKKGYNIVPYSEYEYVVNTRKKCYGFIKLMCATKLGKIAISDHAMSAKDEMAQLQKEME